jgi:hypothetical protein
MANTDEGETKHALSRDEESVSTPNTDEGGRKHALSRDKDMTDKGKVHHQSNSGSFGILPPTAYLYFR